MPGISGPIRNPSNETRQPNLATQAGIVLCPAEEMQKKTDIADRFASVSNEHPCKSKTSNTALFGFKTY